MEGHQGGAQWQTENADVCRKPDPEQLQRIAIAFVFGNGLYATGFQLPGAVPDVGIAHGVLLLVLFCRSDTVARSCL